MRIIVNQTTCDLSESSKICDVLALVNAKPPFAVAVNLNFIPKSKYSEFNLQENDRIEIISPVTGG